MGVLNIFIFIYLYFACIDAIYIFGGHQKCIPHEMWFIEPNRALDHLRMNVAPDINNHLRSIDLFRSMIIKKNRSKVLDSHCIVIG